MIKTQLSWLLAGSLVAAPGLTASSVAEPNVAGPKVKLWKVTYEYCVSEEVIKAHRDKWPEQQLVNTNDGRCVRSLEPLYIYALQRPEVAFLYQQDSQAQTNERFKRDSYQVAIRSNGCVPRFPADFGWYSADNQLSFHASYTNQTSQISIPAQIELVPGPQIYGLLEKLLEEKGLPNPSSESCKILVPLSTAPNPAPIAPSNLNLSN